MSTINVIKHNGSIEPLDLSKAEASLDWATYGIKGVSTSDIMMQSKLHMFDGIKTSYILDVFIKTTYDMSSLRNFGYDKVSARLKLQKLYKQVFASTKPHSIKQQILNHPDKYADTLLGYTNEQLEFLESVIDHSRDFTFTASGVDAMVNQYTIHKNDVPIETPQLIYMLIAMDAAALVFDYDLQWVVDIYEALSTFKITLPTPSMNALRTNSHDYASCEALRVGDFIRSWTSGDTAIVEDTTQSKGIGVHIGDIASLGDKVKRGTISHAGKIPILQSTEKLIGKSSQNGRRGSATIFVNFFDPEIEQILAVKSVRTALDKRINNLSYGICMHQLVYDRALAGQDITLISSRDVSVPSISEALAHPNFPALYAEWELQLPQNKRISARWLLEQIAKERFENSSYYIVNIDEINSNTTYSKPIVQSNICVEFCVPTLPIDRSKPNEPAVGICVLGNVNQALVGPNELPHYMNILVRMQSLLSLKQTHSTPQANAFVKHYRDIGLGFSNHAYWLAKQGLRYGQAKALQAHNEWMEAFAFNTISVSCSLAEELGAAPGFELEPIVKWINGLPKSANHDWNGLLRRITQFGLFNCGLMMNPPSESSSVPSNQTTGLEPIRDLLTIKDKNGHNLKQYAPECIELADKYDFCFDRPITRDYLKHVAVTQVWMDKSISAGTFSNPEHYPDKKVPIKVIVSDIIFAKAKKVKTLYYHNNKVADANAKPQLSCEGGSCDV